MKSQFACLLGVCLVATFVICHQGQHHGALKSGHQSAHHTSMHGSKMSQDIEHVKEHLKEQIDLNKEITAEELEFYYFLEHDFNNDSRLDGLEILGAIQHSDMAHEFSLMTANLTGEALNQANEEEMKEYEELIDEILKSDDVNKDGFISYNEYVFARKRDEKENKSPK